MQSHSKSRRLFVAAALSLVIPIALVACSSAAPATNSTAKKSNVPVPTLVVGTPAALTPSTDIYVAAARGYFKKAGVNVDIKTAVGANGLNELAAGQLDLLMFGTGQALIPVSRGKATTVVYAQIGGGESGALAVAASSPYTSVTQLSGKPVGVLGTGGSAYGWSQIYSAYSASHGGSAFNIVSAASTAAQLDGLLSGHFAAIDTTGSLLVDGRSSGKIRLLEDPNQASWAKKFAYLGGQYAEVATFGNTQTIAKKRVAVERFLAGMVAADSWMKTASPKAVATALKATPDFDGQSLATVEGGVKYDKKFYAPTDGKISSATWKSTLGHLKYWGLPGINFSSKDYSYSQMVDMSYLQGASKYAVKP
jgi:ABC-type nitrate/sulfonate/bicarbonate transport system substrate-binding protein